MKPMKISHVILTFTEKKFFSSFLAYLISKHYIANSIVLIKITLDKAN